MAVLKNAMPSVSAMITRPIPRAKSRKSDRTEDAPTPATLMPTTARNMGRVQLSDAVP